MSNDVVDVAFKQAIGGERRAAHRRLREDADLHALHHHPVGRVSARRYTPCVYARCIVVGMAIGTTFLGLLEAGPRHGYDLKRAYDERFGADRPLSYGQVYATLARLLKNGLVEVEGVEPGAGPDRKRYAITEAGVTDIERWLSQPEKPEPYLQSTLYAKVVLALLDRPRGERPARRAALRAPAADARADRAPARRGHRRRADLRPRALPPGGRPALARADRRAPRRARRR